MVDMGGGFVDDLEVSGHETEVIVNEVESRRRLRPISVNCGRISNTERLENLTHL